MNPENVFKYIGQKRKISGCKGMGGGVDGTQK